MGESLTRSGGRRNGTAPSRATAAQSDWPRAAQTYSGARLRYSSGLDCANHYRSRSQGTPAHVTRRGDLRSETGRRRGISQAALARRRDHFSGRRRAEARPMGPRTDEDTIALLRRLAVLYPDEVIAGILNRQGRKTATGERFTANQVGSLRRYRDIPRFQPPSEPPEGELVSIRKAAQILAMNTSSIHRWLADGFVAGEQITPGAPWQIRITDELRASIVQHAPTEYLPMLEATRKLGVSRQTVLQRVKSGEIKAVLVRQGRRKGLRIRVIDQQPELFQ